MHKFTKLLSYIMTLVLSVSLIQGNLIAGTIPKVYLNGNKILMEQSPFIQDGTTYIPLRATEQFGFTVNWDNKTSTVTLNDGKNIVVQVVGNKQVKVNNQMVDIGAPAIKKNGAVYVPIRFISNALGGQAIHDAKTNRINIQFAINSSQKDLFGRPIRKGNLPTRAVRYPYISAGIPNEMYDMLFTFEKTIWNPEINKEDYYAFPVDMKKKYADEFTHENLTKWIDMSEQYLDMILNFDYRTVSDSWAKDMAALQVDLSSIGDYEMAYIQFARDYMNYAKNKKITVEGDFYLEPSTAYFHTIYSKVRAWIKFKINAPVSKVRLADNEYKEYKSNTWYVGYVDIPIIQTKYETRIVDGSIGQSSNIKELK